jgi:hypothetical protein
MESSPLPTPPPPNVLRSEIDWSAAVRKCLIAALAMTLVMAIVRFPLLGIFVIPAGGWFAVFLYTRGSAVAMDAGRGARLGAVTGLFGFLFSMVRSAFQVYFQRGQFMTQIRKAMDEAARKNPDPKAQEIVEKLMSPEGIAILITLTVIFVLFSYLILTAIGGAIGGARHKRGTAPTA